jgi:hypothetical protein
LPLLLLLLLANAANLLLLPLAVNVAAVRRRC